MMKRFLIILFLLAWFVSPARAQPNNAVQQNLTSATCSLTDTTGCIALTLAGAGGVAVQLQGTFTATVAFEGTVDGATWVALSMTPSNSTTTVTSATSAGVWFAGAGGLQSVRARVSAYTSGTVITSLRSALVSASRGGGATNLQALADGTGTAPSLAFATDPTVGLSYQASDGTHGFGLSNQNGLQLVVGQTWRWGSGGLPSWSSNANPASATADTGMARNAAGTVEVNNGTAGTLRDVLPRLTLDTTAPTSITSTSANSCGTTSPALGTGAANTRGEFTVGATSGTDCTLTFSVAAAHKWVCAPSNETSAALVRAIPVTTTTTSFQGVFGAANVIGYVCQPF